MGLLSHWPLDGDASDIVGGRHGSVSGSGGSWVRGRYGLGRRFTANDDAIVIPHDDKLSSKIFGQSERASVSFWFYPEAFIDYGCIVNKSFSASWSNVTLGVWAYHEGLRFVLGSNVSGNPASSSVHIIHMPPLNVWVHVSAVVDGVYMLLYIDGELVGKKPIPKLYAGRSENTNDLTIGPRYVGHVSGLRGSLCDLKLYDHGLSKREVIEDYVGLLSRYSMSSPKTFRPNKPTAYFPLDNTFADNVNSLTPVNVPTAQFATVDGRKGVDISLDTDVLDYGDVLDVHSGNFTVSYWAYIRNGASLGWVVSKARAAADADRWAVGYVGNKPRVFMQAVAGSSDTPDVVYQGTLAFNDNEWNHFIWSFDRSGNITCYLNNQFAGSVDISFWEGIAFDSTHPTRIGSYNGANGEYVKVIDGVVSDVTMMSYASDTSDYLELSMTPYVHSGCRLSRLGRVYGAKTTDQGIVFDGIDDYVELDNRDIEDNEYEGSLSFWMHPETAASDQMVFYNKHHRDIGVAIYSGRLKAGMYAEGYSWQTLDGGAVLTEITHVCFTWNIELGELNLFVNGHLSDTVTISGGWGIVGNVGPVHLGSPEQEINWLYVTGYYQGLIQDFSFYGTALSADYVRGLANTKLSLDANGTLFTSDFSDPEVSASPGKFSEIVLDEVGSMRGIVSRLPLEDSVRDEIRDVLPTNHGSVQKGVLGYKFNGTNQRLILQQPPLTFTSQAWTISFSIFPIGTAYGIILSPHSGGIDHFVGYQNGVLSFSITESEDTNNRSISANLESDIWSDVAVQLEGESWRIYINGRLVAWDSSTIPIANWNGAWSIGARANNTRHFLGEIHDLRIFDEILTPSEILNIHRTAKSNVGSGMTFSKEGTFSAGRLIET